MKRWFWRLIPLYGAMGVAGAIGYAITGSGQQAWKFAVVAGWGVVFVALALKVRKIRRDRG